MQTRPSRSQRPTGAWRSPSKFQRTHLKSWHEHESRMESRMESRTHCSGQKMKPLTRFVTRASPKVLVGSQSMPVIIDRIKRIVACDLRKVSSDGVLHGIHRGWRLQYGNSTERRRRRDRWRIALSLEATDGQSALTIAARSQARRHAQPTGLSFPTLHTTRVVGFHLCSVYTTYRLGELGSSSTLCYL
jgi:hypothetical protein